MNFFFFLTGRQKMLLSSFRRTKAEGWKLQQVMVFSTDEIFFCMSTYKKHRKRILILALCRHVSITICFFLFFQIWSDFFWLLQQPNKSKYNSIFHKLYLTENLFNSLLENKQEIDGFAPSLDKLQYLLLSPIFFIYLFIFLYRLDALF